MMLILFIASVLGFLIPVIMYFTSFVISYKKGIYFKLCSYECGFDSLVFAHFSYSLMFFLLVMVFVIFELEIIMFIMIILSDFHSFFIFFFVFLYIIFSFYMEWGFNKLIWKI